MKGVIIKSFYPRALKACNLFYYIYVFQFPSLKSEDIIFFLIFGLVRQKNHFCIFANSTIISVGTLIIIER